MPHIHVPPKMANQSLGTPYEKADVIKILQLDQLEVGFKKYYLGKQLSYLAVGGKPPLVKKYIITTTKKVAIDQLQSPTSNLHNVHYCIPILL